MKTRKATNIAFNEKKLLSVGELAGCFGLGLNSARKLGSDAGAVRRFGRRVLYDRAAVEAYIDGLRA